jgi:hypothetical protein
MTLRVRTRADNKQLSLGETQFESTRGAVSALVHYNMVRIATVRGIPGRKLNCAELDAEGLDAFIEHLQELRRKLK